MRRRGLAVLVVAMTGAATAPAAADAALLRDVVRTVVQPGLVSQSPASQCTSTSQGQFVYRTTCTTAGVLTCTYDVNGSGAYSERTEACRVGSAAGPLLQCEVRSGSFADGDDAGCTLRAGALAVRCVDEVRHYPPAREDRSCTLTTGSGAPLRIPLTALP